MGMYTGLHLAIELSRDTPEEVTGVLMHMVGDLPQEPATPSHELFQTDRWGFMLRCSSAYHAYSPPRLHQERDGYWTLTVLSSFKNYEDEIAKFVDWISPYVAPNSPRWIGYRWYEEDDEPTPLYRKGA